ncbi:hypothetical protein W02_07150 [Nitrospira sp. KM1]|uniref:OmpA family protein n=1 Tax=Nitrospira sp. KM1 TaxID=1936990 RepID=UPI0013A78B22|nr:OmpA family protein [Nitrospira sp. KM1]BCA53575.1 hypothetical protein W02_07150 [Nitrospira sp. KM1]
MKRAAILVGGLSALTLLALVCVPRHLPVPAPTIANPIPASFHARLEQGTLTLRGSMPDASTRERILKEARARYDAGKIKIDDQLVVDPQVASAPWLEALPGILPVLGMMNTARGSIIIDGRSLVLSGRVATEQSKIALLSSITPMTAAGLELEDHILSSGGHTTPSLRRGSLQPKLDAVLAKARIEFESNKAVLSAKGIAALDQIVPLIRDYPQASIEIGGHTDPFGAPAYNVDLSHRRAEAVRQYFVKHGLGNKFTAVGYGASKPRSKEQTQAALQRNRRIELHVTGNGDL